MSRIIDRIRGGTPLQARIELAIKDRREQEDGHGPYLFTGSEWEARELRSILEKILLTMSGVLTRPSPLPEQSVKVRLRDTVASEANLQVDHQPNRLAAGGWSRRASPRRRRSSG